jgi:hypothetical protein
MDGTIDGPLPIHRLTPSLPPFAHTGVDFFRPMMVKVGGRGRRHEKNNLSIEAFIGKPLVMYSDNGLNFVGAERELTEPVTESVRWDSRRLGRAECFSTVDLRFEAKSPDLVGSFENINFRGR